MKSRSSRKLLLIVMSALGIMWGSLFSKSLCGQSQFGQNVGTQTQSRQSASNQVRSFAQLPTAAPDTAPRASQPNPPMGNPNFTETASRVPMRDRTVRIKDVTTVEGHRTNRLSGLGLVTGLKGTGGKSQVTRDASANILRASSIGSAEIPTGSTSVVVVTAEVPPFSRPGQVIPATVSVFDDASGLFGGLLSATELKGYDGRVYAVAGGSITLSGYSASGESASVSKNHDTTGSVNCQIEETIEKDVAFPNSTFRLLLKNRDYATAQRISDVINQFYPGHARTLDQGCVEVLFPTEVRSSNHRKMQFFTRIDELRFVPDAPARVVINQKSGVIVVGQNVKLGQVMFASENLIISTTETPVVSQPAPLSQGATVVVPRTNVNAVETSGNYNVLQHESTVGDLATMLNRLGVRPRELITIFQEIEAAGQLQAELIIQ